MSLFALMALLSLSSQGTLVLTVPTQTGIVMCADRREYNSVKGATDKQDKIFKLSDTSAFSIAGNRGILDPKDLHPLYDVPAVVMNYFKSHPDSRPDWDALQIELAQSYIGYLTAGGPEWKPADLSDGYLYMLTFIYVDAKKPHIVRIGTNLTEEAFHSMIIDYPAAKALGQTDVVGELESGKNTAFDQTRSNPSVKPFLSGTKTEENTTAQEAVGYSKVLIQTTSRLYHLLNSGPSMVSENYDCALIGSGGFSWLKRNAK